MIKAGLFPFLKSFLCLCNLIRLPKWVKPNDPGLQTTTTTLQLLKQWLPLG